jgi:hypothetical protein
MKRERMSVSCRWVGKRKSKLTFVGSENRDSLSGRSRGRGHDENSDVLLQGEVARVEESPETTAVSSRESLGPCFTENESDDLKEELRDVDGLGTEVEDLSGVRESVAVGVKM